MPRFYFISFLALLQVLYWIALRGISGHWIQNEFIRNLSIQAVQSGWCGMSRLAIIVLEVLMCWERVRALILKCLAKRIGYMLLLLAWIISSGCFLLFDTIFYVHKHQEWMFFIFLLGALTPLFLKVANGPISLDAQAFKAPNKHNRDSEFSIALPTVNGGSLPINNPLRGIYILGSAGSGKTRFILEPIIYKFFKKGYCGIIYDYDFEGVPVAPERSYCLSKFAYNCYLKFCDPSKFDFKIINFTDPSRSFRVNPIDPEYIANRAYLEEYVNVLLKNLNPGKKDDFWHLSTKSLLKGIIVYFSNKAKSLCTLPHVITLASRPIHEVLDLIKDDREAYEYASSIFDAARGGEKSSAQLIGIVASFKSSLQTLINKDLFWILSDSEVNTSVNRSDRPTILCIGNFPPSKSAFSPIIALLITVCFKSMYGHGRNKSFVAIDELPTLYIPDLAELPATARKYGISTVACVQSNAQLEKTYGNVASREIQENLSNQFVGNCGVFSAAYGSSLFGKKDHIVTSSSTSTSFKDIHNHKTVSANEHLQEKEALKPQEFLGMAVGSFSGKVVESNGSLFRHQFKSVSSFDDDFVNSKLKDIPVFNKVSETDIVNNQNKIFLEIDLLLGKKHG